MPQQTFNNGEALSSVRTKLNSNATDAQSRLTAAETKLSGIEAGATADQTGAEIKAAYEAEANTNAVTIGAPGNTVGYDAYHASSNYVELSGHLTGGGMHRIELNTPGAGPAGLGVVGAVAFHDR